MIGNLNQVIEDFETITDFTDNGKCSGCGNCCTNYLPMTNNEISKIKSYIKQNKVKEQLHCVPFNTGVVDLTCPFMKTTGNKRCTIYEVRPRICRQFKCDKDSYTIVPSDLQAKPIFVRETFFSVG